MNNRIKITILELLVIVIFLIISKFIGINAFSFCAGATYIILFYIIESYFGSDKK